MLNKNLKKVFLIVLCIIGSGTLLSGCSKPDIDSYMANSFKRLEAVRTDRKKTILSKLQRLMEKTASARDDDVLHQSFFALKKNPSNNSAFLSQFSTISRNLDTHYVSQYADFYDILFIDESGFVFHTIKQEADYQTHLFQETATPSNLSTSLMQNPEARFIDFDFYAPSREAASFFILPVTQNGNAKGWVVFQFAINAINTALKNYENLGKTGEVYLTNTSKMMLTQSRLLPQDTVLNLKVETAASATNGSYPEQKIITDYRKIRVLSSFEKIEFAGTSWIIVVEIDEDEVLSEFYQENSDQLQNLIYTALTAGTPVTNRSFKPSAWDARVDINEYGKVLDGQQIGTMGVATCTAIIISNPGDFVYLGHIYPLDKSLQSPVENMLLNIGFSLSDSKPAETPADLLHDLLYNLTWHDIPPANIRQLKVTIAAVHTSGYQQMINKLLSAGLLPSQIKIIYNPQMTYVNVESNSKNPTGIFQWVNTNNNLASWVSTAKVANLGDLIKQVSASSS